MPELRFTKMHGAGNDYLYVDATQDTPNLSAEQISHLADRRFGVGGDGVVLLAPPTQSGAELRMRMYNADGSEGDMCGNALRCIAKLALDRGLVQNNPLVVQTNAGLITMHAKADAEGKVVQVRVDMLEPRLLAAEVPLKIEAEQAVDTLLADLAPEIDPDRRLRFTALSMGNPHAVFFVEEPTDELVLELGPKIEQLPQFPDRVNVEFVRIDSRSSCAMRVWERGSGETLACGSGACAALVAGVLTERLDRRATIDLLGGQLQIEWDHKNHVWMTGPAVQVFDGVCEV